MTHYLAQSRYSVKYLLDQLANMLQMMKLMPHSQLVIRLVSGRVRLTSQPPMDSVALSHLQVKVGNGACPAHSSALRTCSCSLTHCSAGFAHVTVGCFFKHLPGVHWAGISLSLKPLQVGRFGETSRSSEGSTPCLVFIRRVLFLDWHILVFS